jgi:hypothetical protein
MNNEEMEYMLDEAYSKKSSLFELNEIIGYLPHGLRLEFKEKLIFKASYYVPELGCLINGKNLPFELDNCKPLLLPPEAMSDEQLSEYNKIAANEPDLIKCATKLLDFFHRNMINYRGLDALDMREYE